MNKKTTAIKRGNHVNLTLGLIAPCIVGSCDRSEFVSFSKAYWQFVVEPFPDSKVHGPRYYHRCSGWFAIIMTSSNGKFSALQSLCAGNSQVAGEFPSHRPVTRLNKRLSKQSWGQWFEMPSRSLWRHTYDEYELKYWDAYMRQWTTSSLFRVIVCRLIVASGLFY